MNSERVLPVVDDGEVDSLLQRAEEALLAPTYVIGGVEGRFREGRGPSGLAYALMSDGFSEPHAIAIESALGPGSSRVAWSVGFLRADDESAGLGPHVDSDEVHSLQLSGTRTWQVVVLGSAAVSTLQHERHLTVPDDLVEFDASMTWTVRSEELCEQLRGAEATVLSARKWHSMPAYSAHDVRTVHAPAVSYNIGILRRRGHSREVDRNGS